MSAWNDDVERMIEVYAIPNSDALKMWNPKSHASYALANQAMLASLNTYVMENKLESSVQPWSDTVTQYIESADIPYIIARSIWNNLSPQTTSEMLRSLRSYVRKYETMGNAKRVRDERLVEDKITLRPIIVIPDDIVENEIQRRLQRACKKDDVACSNVDIYRRNLNHVYENCTSTYEKRPWIGSYSHTLIANVPQSSVKFPKKFVSNESQPRVIDGIKWYTPSPLFTILICSGVKSQRGNVFSVVSRTEGARYMFLIGHVLTDGRFVVQDEDMFQKESEWIGSSKGSETDIMEYALDSKYGSTAREVAYKSLRRCINTSVPDSYVRDIVASAYADTADNEGTVGDFLRSVSSVAVFCMSEYLGTRAVVFNTRLVNKMYDPSIIYKLSFSEKFPEYRGEEVDRIISTSVNEIAQSMARDVFFTVNPTHRAARYPSPPSSIIINEKQRVVRVCPGYEPWEVVWYQDACFSIYELLSEFAKGNYTNPNSGTKFDDEFVSSLMRKFKRRPDGDFEDIFGVGESLQIGAPDVGGDTKYDELVDRLISKINELEEVLVSRAPADLAGICAYCNTYSDPGNNISTFDASGELVKFCSTNCLEKSKNI